jgi:NAD(P)-dependent dehydrogenase (short-subunit alcohol dehydrogenase family)
MRTVNGMNAVITGAGSGIGRELAIQLSRLGAAVIVTDIDKNGLDETCLITKKNCGNCVPYVFDVSDRQKVYAFADEAVRKHGHIDILINNAGKSMHGYIEDLTYESFELIMGINFWGVVYTAPRPFCPTCSPGPTHIS